MTTVSPTRPPADPALPPVPPTPAADDFARARALASMKRIALGLLLLAAVIYAVARTFEADGAAWAYVRAFAEAAMVGALADWFAVTALFRHPLRLPIPHTAIIPERKAQLGRSLGDFVETNFMSRDVLVERLAHAAVARRFGEWLAEEDNAATAARSVADVLRGVIEVVDDAEVQGAIERIVEHRIRSTPAAPLLGRGIELAMEGGHHRALLDAIFRGLRGFLDDNRATFRERLQQESPWWVPERIDDRIFAKIADGIDRFLVDVGGDPDHEVRRSIERRVAAFAVQLRTDPSLVERGERLKDELLDHPEMRAWIGSLWREAKTTLIAATHDPDSELYRRLVSSLQRLGVRLRDDGEMRAKVDGWIAGAVGYVVDHHRREVGRLIESTIERWDGDETARKMELQVGRDLQFIRINGTLVGGLAGLAIHAVSELILR